MLRRTSTADHPTREMSMYKLPIALLLTGAAATSAFAMAAQPAQNSIATQRQSHRGHEGANPTHVRPGAVERRIVNNPGTPPGSVTPQTSTHPQFTPRRVGGVEQHRPSVVPRTEVNQRATELPNIRRSRPPVVSRVPGIEDGRVNEPTTERPNIRRSRPVVSRIPRIGTEPPLRAEPSNRRPHWNRNWRNNRQYDWSSWRQRNRSVFRLHPYRDPYGWGYRLFSIGWRLWPQYYASSYWIEDPSMYRLPPAPPGTRWIRYYNDALLVDMWTGEVIDAIPNFFW